MKTKKKSYFAGKVSGNAKKQAKRSNNFGYLNLPKGIDMFKETPGGRSMLDIMPYTVMIKNHPDFDPEVGCAAKGDLWYRFPFRIHRNVGSKKETIVCPETFGKKCPICEERNRLFKEKAGKDETDLLKTSRRVLYCVIPKENKKLEEVPHLWDISQAMFQELLNEEITENEQYENFPDLQDGFTLKIRFDEQSFAGNAYAKASRIDFEDRDPYDESILEDIPCLDNLLKILDYETIKAKFYELEDEDVSDDTEEDEDEEEEETPKKTARKPLPKPPVKGRKKPEPEEEEEEEEEDDDEEEEEEEEKPVRKPTRKPVEKPATKSTRRMSPPEPEEEDEDDDDKDEDDDDEDEPEPPAQLKRTRPALEPLKAKKKPAPEPTSEPEDGEDDLPFEDKIRIGTMVKVPTYGECEIVALNKKERTGTVAEEDGERHPGIPWKKMQVISFGKYGEPGKITKKEQEAAGKKPKSKCPIGKWGEADDHEECEDCPLWNDCMDVKEG